MKKTAFSGGVILAFGLLSGCATNVDGTTTLGAIESPAWHNTASMETKVAHFTAKCAAVGYQRETNEMRSCVMQSMSGSSSAASQQMAGALASAGKQLSQQNAPQYRSPTNCTVTSTGASSGVVGRMNCF